MDDEKAQCCKQNISLIFLDVDGVLNTNNRDKTKKNKVILALLRSHVERLKEIITSTNIECKICISSAWRLCKYAVQYLKKNLISMGHIDVENVIIGQTPSISRNDDIQSSTQQRISEIQSYLNNDKILKSKYNVVTFCVIDDLDLSGVGMNHFVHINPKYGLTESDSHRILSILNQSPLNQDGRTQKLIKLKSKPRIKLLFIAALENNYNDIANNKRLQIILNKTKCALVTTKHKYTNDVYNNSFKIDDFNQIKQYITDLEQQYYIESWAVLDYINIHQQYTNNQPSISRRFIKIDSSQDLALNDVLATVSILNKWS